MRRPAVRQLVLVLAILVGSAIPTSTASAYQSYAHGYSKGDYWPSIANLSGIYLRRTDVDVVMTKQWSTCDQPFTGWPVYQPAWVFVTQSGSDWVEIGTGHQCNGYRYWYWGYGWQSGWYPLGTASQPNPDITVYPEIHRLAETWYWLMSGVQKATMYWNAIGYSAQTGVESYDDHAYIPATLYDLLQVTRSEGPWVAWESVSPVVTPGLCWTSSNPGPAFYAWQDTSC